MAEAAVNEPVVTPAPPAPTPAPKETAPPAPAPEPKSLLTDGLEEEVKPSPEDGTPTPPAIELKVPEKSLLDAASVERIASFAKERGLSQEQAQALLERDHENLVSSEVAQKAALDAQSKQWVKDIISDKEIGGEGAKQNIALAHRVIEKFASPVLVQQLRETGLGNHPELIRLFVNVGKLMSDDQLVLGNGAPTVEKSAAEIFYPSMTKKES